MYRGYKHRNLWKEKYLEAYNMVYHFMFNGYIDLKIAHVHQISFVPKLKNIDSQVTIPWYRIRTAKSHSEGSGDSDSLGSMQESAAGSSSQLPGQNSIDEGDAAPPPLDYDTVLVISLNTSSPPECPGLMSEEKVLSTVQVFPSGVFQSLEIQLMFVFGNHDSTVIFLISVSN